MTGSSSTVWFYFLTDRQVSLEENKSISWTDLNGNQYSIDRNNPQSANDILKFTSPMDITTSVNTGFLNLSHINNVYITSPNLSSFDTIATFSNNIIKQVPVTSSYGVMVVDQFISVSIRSRYSTPLLFTALRSPTICGLQASTAHFSDPLKNAMPQVGPNLHSVGGK